MPDLFAVSRTLSKDERLEQARANMLDIKSLTTGRLGHLYGLLDGVLNDAKHLGLFLAAFAKITWRRVSRTASEHCF
jgi:hypothetical protein